tara:strand:- start:263 stop:910 length:648 start_codon:yes stop_codon:yes gene_type:complete
MIYVIKKFDEYVKDNFSYYIYMDFSGIKDEEYSEFWKKHSEIYFESLDIDEKQKFIKHYPNYISNVFSECKGIIEKDADVLNEWKIYLDKISKPEYWNFDLVIKDDSLFNNPDAEQFFSYLTDTYKREDDLKAVTLSFIYHKFNGSYIDSKESLYVEYCNDKFSGLKFTQLQQKSRFRKDEPAYDSDTAIIRRNIFNKALENWNNLYSNKQLKFY